jgi:hypothetical protein
MVIVPCIVRMAVDLKRINVTMPPENARLRQRRGGGS